MYNDRNTMAKGTTPDYECFADMLVPDIYIKDPCTGKLIGRPCIFYIANADGLYIRGASMCISSLPYEGFINAIKDCGEDKVALYRTFNIMLTGTEFHTRELPESICVDMSKYWRCKKMIDAIDTLGITLYFKPAHTPSFPIYEKVAFYINKLLKNMVSDGEIKATKDGQVISIDKNEMIVVLQKAVAYYNIYHCS